MRKTFFISLLILLSTAAAWTQTSANATWRVTKYDLTVSLPQAENSRAANIRALITAKNISGSPASSLTLRISPNAEVTAVTVNGSPVEPAKAEEKTAAGTSLQRIGLRISPVAPSSEVTASVDYKLTVKENSALGTISPAGSMFLPLSYWYPTPNSWFFVKGADMAPVRMKVSVPAGMQVATAGGDAGGTFDSKLNGQPFFLTGDWDVSEQSGVSVFLPKGSVGEPQKRAAELGQLFSDARTFMASVLGDTPQVPLRIISSRRGGGFAEGGTLIVDEAVFRRSKIDSLTAMNIAEAAAKLWLGGSVAISGDGYGVVAEGLARYLATQFIESKFGKDVADIERLRQRVSYANISQRDAPMAQVTPADDSYYPIVANKGAMVWRILSKRVGAAEFASTIKANTQDGNLSLAELRQGFASQKPILDYFLDQVTTMDLLAGKPRQENGEWHIALRNTGPTDVTVDVAATASDGERIITATTIPATSFGDVAFRTAKTIVRAEVDLDKLYPQSDFADDIAPQVTTDSDPLLAAKRLLDKQDYAGAETTARTLLRDHPRSDELRITLGRALLAQGKTGDAQKEFQAVLDEKLPAARSLAWANEGLAEIASRAGQTDAVGKYATTAILTDGEYGASLAARNLRQKAGLAATDAAAKAFFADLDKAAAANRKADVGALVLSGEVTRFASGMAGSAQAWQTTVRNVDRLDSNTLLVEADMNIRLINKEPESGPAVYRLVKTAAGWRLGGVEVFEVR